MVMEENLKNQHRNDFSASINNVEPVKKRLKLVLAEPQISDSELEQVVKSGKENQSNS